jgi:hypothetical protein
MNSYDAHLSSARPAAGATQPRPVKGCNAQVRRSQRCSNRASFPLKRYLRPFGHKGARPRRVLQWVDARDGSGRQRPKDGGPGRRVCLGRPPSKGGGGSCQAAGGGEKYDVCMLEDVSLVSVYGAQWSCRVATAICGTLRPVGILRSDVLSSTLRVGFLCPLDSSWWGLSS